MKCRICKKDILFIGTVHSSTLDMNKGPKPGDIELEYFCEECSIYYRYRPYKAEKIET